MLQNASCASKTKQNKKTTKKIKKSHPAGVKPEIFDV